jgi:hypothetical protein
MNYDYIHYLVLPRAGAKTSIYQLRPKVLALCGSSSGSTILIVRAEFDLYTA